MCVVYVHVCVYVLVRERTRNMLQLYQDAMAIVRKYGEPDLFITMTCNLKWREIEENLLP